MSRHHLLARGAALALTALLFACLPLRPAGRGAPLGRAPESALRDLIDGWPTGSDTVTIAGFRLADGTTSAATEALDQLLLAAAAGAGVAIRPEAGVAGSASARDLPWGADEALPREWRTLGGLVAGGQLLEASDWVYLRLVLADGRQGRIRRHATARLAARDLQRLAVQRQLAAGQPAPPPQIGIELHLLVRRDVSGFAQRIDWVEGGALDQYDQVQLRLRASQDCDVWAFLFRSDGQRETLYDGGTVYGGRWTYGPGEEGWVSLTEGDQVYTVYVLAAPRIEADRGTLWEEVGQLQERGRIERFQGLDLVDGAVARLLQRTVDADTIAVSRGAEGVERGEPERFVYVDGTTLDSRGEQLHGAAIARAYSAQVHYR